MASDKGLQLSEGILRNIEDLKKACAGLDDERASRAPEGRWSPKQVLSHLCGPEGSRLTNAINMILKQETPIIEIDPGNPFFTENRSKMSVAELLSVLGQRYVEAAALLKELSEDQLMRKVHVPAFKEAPMGEYLTLYEFMNIIGIAHLQSHTTHLREILKELAEG